MTLPAAKLRLLGSSLLLLFALAPPAFAEDFQAQQPIQPNQSTQRWDWANPLCWKNAENKNAVPSAAADVGIVSRGHQIGITTPLGTDGNRPSIRVETGGRVLLGQDMVNPLILDGGNVSGMWLGKTLDCPIAVTADSTFDSRDDDNVQLRIAGSVHNSKPVTIHLNGGMEWLSNSSKTYTGNIAIDRGQVSVSGSLGTGMFGSGSIFLAAQTRLVVRHPVENKLCVLNNDISGAGTIQASTGEPLYSLVDYGKTIQPGSASRPGTLVIAGSLIFERDTAGHPAKLLIDVQGDGSTPATDYGQLAITGNLANCLNNVDLILRLAPDMPADKAAKLHLIVLSAVNADELAKANFRPFHSVLVECGDKKGSATVNITHDPLTDQRIATVSDITLK